MTETKPDPQVIHLTTGSQTLCGVTSRDVSTALTLRPEQMTCGYCQAIWDRIHSLPEPAPLTPADVPAGQGPASLYVERKGDGGLSLWFQTADGFPVNIQTERVYSKDTPRLGAAERALWDHLAATLPTVTAEGAP